MPSAKVQVPRKAGQGRSTKSENRNKFEYQNTKARNGSIFRFEPFIMKALDVVLCFVFLGTWHLALGTWHLELGTWNLELLSYAIAARMRFTNGLSLAPAPRSWYTLEARKRLRHAGETWK